MGGSLTPAARFRSAATVPNRAALFDSARRFDLMATTSAERLPMAAAWNVAELEDRAARRLGQHRYALHIARTAAKASTRHINLHVAAGERRAYGSAVEALRFWRGVLSGVAA